MTSCPECGEKRVLPESIRSTDTPEGRVCSHITVSLEDIQKRAEQKYPPERHPFFGEASQLTPYIRKRELKAYVNGAEDQEVLFIRKILKLLRRDSKITAYSAIRFGNGDFWADWLETQLRKEKLNVLSRSSAK